MWRPLIWDKPGGRTGEEERKAEQQRFDKNLEEHLLEWKALTWIHESSPRRKRSKQRENSGELTPTYFKEKKEKIGSKFLCREELRREQRYIVKYMLEHPLKSYETAGRELWVDPHRIASLLDRYKRIKMAREDAQQQDLIWMYEDVLNDIAEITADNIKKYKNSNERLRTNELKDLSTIAKETQERKNLLEGKPTENQAINITFN